MHELLRRSVDEVMQQQLGLEIEPCKSHPRREAYCVSTQLSYKTREALVTIWFQRPTLKKFSQILLFEEDPDETTLIDMAKECANFIVGHAKMIAHDNGEAFKMGLPESVGLRILERSDNRLLFKVFNRCMGLQWKETHG